MLTKTFSISLNLMPLVLFAQFALGVERRPDLFYGSEVETALVDGYSIKHVPCIPPTDFKSLDPRLFDALESQKNAIDSSTTRLKVLLARFGNGLRPEHLARFSREMDHWIDARGQVRSNGGKPSAEAVVWGYMNTPHTMLTAEWNPFKWGVYGAGYKDVEDAYGFDLSVPNAFTNRAVVKSYPKALKYMDEKNKAKAEEAKLTSGLVRLGVSVALSTLLAIPSMGATFSLAALSGAVMSDFTDHAAVFARAELIHRAHQAVVKSWDEPGHNTDEVLAANVDKISDLASVDIKISAASLYSLYRSTRIQLNSIGETAELVSYRTGVSPADSASFSLSSRQAMKSVNEIQKVLDRRWNALNTACDGRVRSAIHSVQVYSKATVKGADTAFAEMIRAKTECLASQYVLLVTEIRWMAALANEAIYACQAMSAVKFAQ